MGSSNTAQKMKLSIKDFLSKCDKILVQENTGVNLLCNLHKKTVFYLEKIFSSTDWLQKIIFAHVHLYLVRNIGAHRKDRLFSYCFRLCAINRFWVSAINYSQDALIRSILFEIYQDSELVLQLLSNKTDLI